MVEVVFVDSKCGKPNLFRFDVTELQYTVMFAHVVTAFFGADIWKTEVSKRLVSLIDAQLICG